MFKLSPLGKRLGSIPFKPQPNHPLLNDESSVIGFVGLGNMGFNMAKNLVTKSSNSIIVYDINKDATSKFSQIQVPLSSNNDSPRISVASNLSEIAAKSNYIITMLPESAHVKAAYCGKDGLLAHLKPGTVCIDSSTIDTHVSIEVSNLISDKGAIPLDAPVSGGVMGAEAGSLTFMVGGRSSDEFLIAKDILQFMGSKIIHCGGLGTGQTVKICNNMLLGSAMIATAEAMALGTKLGVDPKLLSTVINSSSGRCWSSEVSNPCPGVLPNAPSSRDYNDGFASKLMLKDMYLSLNAAKSQKIPLLLSSLSTQIYGHVCNDADLANKDFSSVFKWINKK
ncbi:3-hydroxyisobutyrate dehydrogenase, mitochondrial [Smittium mucronatum]|uniref:3-hydroxyisobutyrate dehydrogenase n=1 Tax=Smittium mucronatum TaxID=133383 RepID=A0A1R0H3Q3_9FUNG|nr:3-hydroxyisobutyrate dehydrogenase, mitochondrial [Smittium mucronatum]